MKKRILFIISNLQSGGVSKSLTSLMNVIDRKHYDVSLMVISPKGPFMELLPSDIRLIENPLWEMVVSGPMGVLKLFKSGHPLLAIGHLIRLTLSCIDKSMAGEMIARQMPALKEEFDVVVDFNGQQQLYYMVDKLQAKKKITFFHSDYAKWPYYYKADKKYYPKVDKIFTVSPQCVASLKKFFPAQSDKIGLMENISSLEMMEKMAVIEDAPEMKGRNSLLTVGHVCENKGILWAIDAAAILKSRGIDFHWYFLGSVDKPRQYNELVRAKGVEDRITFLGIHSNPYPYLKKTSIVVHPSKFEGRSIALDEAKLFCKPVVVTNFSTVADQFTNRENATICKMDPSDIADSIEELLEDKILQLKYIESLRSSRHDNSSEICKLYAAFDD